MLNHLDIANWSVNTVREWLAGLCDDSSWLQPVEEFEANKLNGKRLLLMSPRELDQFGATKVDLQERIIESIEKLRIYSDNVSRTTLQIYILRLATQARSLHQQLVAKRNQFLEQQTVFNNHNHINNNSRVALPTDHHLNNKTTIHETQRVCLDTLAQISVLVWTVREITGILNSKSFLQHKDYRSMKSLLLALSIELTSTAQRDQFVEKPNDILEKSSKTLADYCYKIVQGTNDLLLVEPFQLETVRIKRNLPNTDFGLAIKSIENNTHIVDKISPLSPAQRTNKLSEGDEIVQYNRCIIGWSAKSVERQVREASSFDEVIVTIKRPPRV